MDAWTEYVNYGGLPLVALMKGDDRKAKMFILMMCSREITLVMIVCICVNDVKQTFIDSVK